MFTRWKRLLATDEGSEDITVPAPLVEIIRTHGESVEILATVPHYEVDEKFAAVCRYARQNDLPGRISQREKVAA